MCISYIGGKSQIGRWVRDHITRDIKTYVEPFGGMYWVFFRTDLSEFKNLQTVVYNDYNPLNFNLFNCVREHSEFSKVLDKIPSQNKDLFYDFQSEIFSAIKLDMNKPNFEIGAKYAYVLSQVWSGTNPEKAKFIDLKGKYKSKYDSFRDKIKNDKWKKMFDRINIVESLDFQDCINKYDSEDSYFYCDPPYYMTEKYYANHDFGIETHERLANCLKSIKGRFSLSYYDFPQLLEWFPKDEYTWKSQEFSKAAMAKAGKSQTKGVELLIMNY